jgi:hypothetical protein
MVLRYLALLALGPAALLAGCGSDQGADDRAVCSAPTVEASLRRAVAPDTAEIKRRAAAGDYPLKPRDIDALAAGLNYRFDGVQKLPGTGDRATCTATLSVTSAQYDVATEQPVPIRYSIERGAGGPTVTLIGNEGPAASAQVFEQIATKLSDVFRSGDDQARATAETRGYMTDPNAPGQADPVTGLPR